MYALSLDGGGAAGYITVKVLDYLEKETKQPCGQLFDLISGVSTGSIIGVCLATGMPAAELLPRYQRIIKAIFSRKQFPLSSTYYSVRDLFKAKYSLDPVEQELVSVFGYTQPSFKTRFMCHTVRVTNGTEAVFWKSWRDNNELDFINAIICSCSAPTFFKPRIVKDNLYVDGALASNCTSMCALTECLRLQADLDSLYIVNMQTGDTPSPSLKKMRKAGGALSWAAPIAEIIITSGSEIAEYQAHQLIDFRNHVIKPDQFPGLDCTDFGKMDKLADKVWETHRKALLDKLVLS